MEEITIDIYNISKKYKDKIVFDDFSIKFYKNKINTIVGKSGCGKSTLLNIISGVIDNDSEKIFKLKDLDISYIFQEDRLIEWLTVEENIKLVCESKYNKKDFDSVCNKYLEILRINEFKKYYPQMLSGGVRQRVNIARGLIFPSEIIIMDEPFKSIDIKNKQNIMERIKDLQNKENRTIIFVTHDIDEALYLSDKVFVLGGSPLNIKKILDNKEELSREDVYTYI